MNSFEEGLVFEISVLQVKLEQAQADVKSLKRRIRGLSKYLADYQSDEPITDREVSDDQC